MDNKDNNVTPPNQRNIPSGGQQNQNNRSVRQIPTSNSENGHQMRPSSENGTQRSVRYIQKPTPVVRKVIPGRQPGNNEKPQVREIRRISSNLQGYNENNHGAGGNSASAQSEKADETRVIAKPFAQSKSKSEQKQTRQRKQKKDSGSLRDRLREEGNNAVISLVKAAIYLVCVFLVSAIISATVIMVANDIFAFVKEDRAVTVSVPVGTDCDGLTQILSDNGLIKYPSVFKFYAKHEGVNEAKFVDSESDYDDSVTVFFAGTYELNVNMDYEDMIATFLPPVLTGTSWVTIPEGYTTDEIIDLLVEKGIGTKEGYIDAINNYDYDFWFVDELDDNVLSKDRIYRLDGYLFPDTYEFYNASSESAVIYKLLERFDEIFTEEYRTKTKEAGYSVDEIITIASMVEKEAGNAADYFYIAEVFRNRLEDPMKYLQTAQPLLQSDATVMYYIQHATGERPDKTTSEDTALDVPYNTYVYPGLPPGPISNPSATAILSALYPSDKGYCYFVSGAEKTYFSTSYWQHLYYLDLVASGKG